MKTCECCGKQSDNRYDIEYDEESDQMMCGTCYTKFQDSIEDHEIRNRRKIAESNEY